MNIHEYPIGNPFPERNCYYDPVTAAVVTGVVVAGAATASAVESRKQTKLAKKAKEEQDERLAKQAKIQEKADLKVAEQAAIEGEKTTERRRRLSTGRRGLLFEGKETGVTDKKDVLGG